MLVALTVNVYDFLLVLIVSILFGFILGRLYKTSSLVIVVLKLSLFDSIFLVSLNNQTLKSGLLGLFGVISFQLLLEFVFFLSISLFLIG